MKKTLYFILILCMILPISYTFFGCKKGNQEQQHIHTFSTTINYGVDEDGKAFTYKKCSCGETNDKTYLQEDSYKVVTPETAQLILDSNINNKTIIFNKGTNTYKYEEQLELRVTESTVEDIYNWNKSPISKNELSSTYSGYHYFRTIKNVNFVCVDGVEFTKMFVCESTYTTTSSRSANRNWDYVRNVASGYDVNIHYFSHINLENCVFDNFNFTGKDGRFTFNWTCYDTHAKDISIQNCSFNTNVRPTTDPTLSTRQAAIRMYGDRGSSIDCVKFTTLSSIGENLYENIKIINNTFVGHEQCLYIQHSKNVDIENNTADRIEHSCYSIHAYSTGNIKFINNTITSSHYYSFYVNDSLNSTILVQDNILSNSGKVEDSTISLMPFSSLSNVQVTCTNNYYNNTKLTETLNKEDEFILQA